MELVFLSASASAATAAASDSTSSLTSFYTSGRYRRRRPPSILVSSSNRPPDYTDAHLRLRSPDSPASLPPPPLLQSPAPPDPLSSGITIAAAASDSTSSLTSPNSSGRYRHRRTASVLALTSNRPPDYTDAHLRLQSPDSPASLPPPPLLQSPAPPDALSSGITIAAAAAAFDSTSSLTSPHSSGRYRHRRSPSVLALTSNRPPDYTDAHLRLQSLDSPASLPPQPPLQSPALHDALSSGNSTAAAASDSTSSVAEVSHSPPPSLPDDPRVPTEHLSLVKMSDHFTWTFLIRLVFRVLELEIELAEKAEAILLDGDVIASILEQLGGAEKFGKLGEMFTCKEKEKDAEKVTRLGNSLGETCEERDKIFQELTQLKNSLRETCLDRDKAMEELASLKKHMIEKGQAKELESFRAELLPRVADLKQNDHSLISAFTQDHVPIKSDSILNFDAVASLKNFFTKISGIPANDTSVKLKAETIAMFGIAVAFTVLHTGFDFKSLMKHVKKEIPKEFYDSIKAIAMFVIVNIFQTKSRAASPNKRSTLKVFIDGSAVGHTVDTKTCNDYKSLSSVIQGLFEGLGLIDGTCNYELLYEDKKGRLLIVGEAPWETFITSDDIECLWVKKRLNMIK